MVKDGSKPLTPYLGRGPHRDGYIFTGWFFDQEGNNYADFDQFVLTSDMTVYAGWEKEKTSGCNKAAIINIISTLLFAMSISFVIKKKH